MNDHAYVIFHKSLMHASHWISRDTGELIALTPMQKILWLHIKDRHDFFTGLGKSWFESHEAIGEAVNCSRDTVITFMQALEQHGYLEVARRTVRGSQLQNTYVILADLKVTHVPKQAKAARVAAAAPVTTPVQVTAAAPVAPKLPVSTSPHSDFEDDPFANVSVLPTREAA
ncbi:DUF6945 domain-containing protein [Pseudomonas sp. PS02290]|uniref:DUF6945 domain-containing protein n=1 Tax=Pseudomonas sp. PS02290 TaxID=2991430 RepID=UPI00249BB8A6|nr:helix-turn-helix domain-containing protein [Pseudomonas sp. PS02290]